MIMKSMNTATSPLFALVGILCVAAVAGPCLADTKGDFVNPPLKFRARPTPFRPLSEPRFSP
jgi:hypothetical protein